MVTLPPPSDLASGLYIVATPIGNLGDISARGIAVLRGAGAIACEDTRVTGKLLHHLGIMREGAGGEGQGARKRLIRYDDHTDDSRRNELIALMAMMPVALVSDAGTPLIADPGYRLVAAARAAGIRVTSVPGACAAITALTLSGLPSDRFCFAGFLPAKARARDALLAELGAVPASLVVYETAPRLVASLTAIATTLPGREVAVARELTKLYEECRAAPPAVLIAHYTAHPPKGEIVLVIGPPAPKAFGLEDAERLLAAELAHAPPARAAAAVARATGLDRKMLYAMALRLP